MTLKSIENCKPSEVPYSLKKRRNMALRIQGKMEIFKVVERFEAIEGGNNL